MAKIVKLGDKQKTKNNLTADTGAALPCLQLLFSEFQILDRELKLHYKKQADERKENNNSKNQKPSDSGK
jgi:hypothetical protein